MHTTISDFEKIHPPTHTPHHAALALAHTPNSTTSHTHTHTHLPHVAAADASSICWPHNSQGHIVVCC